MLSIGGQFTFTADQPQLHCATFFIGEPEELIMIDYDFVNIDCQGGDFLKVRSWQVLLCFLFPGLICHVWYLLHMEGPGECECAQVCVFVCAEQALRKQPFPGWLFLLPEALHYPITTPLKQRQIQAEDSSPSCSIASSELF